MAKSKEELKRIALALYEKKIFTNFDVQDKKDVSKVFLQIPLGKFQNMTPEELNNIGMVFEYKDKASPGMVEDYPTFTTLDYVTIQELDVVVKIMRKYESMKQALEAGAIDVPTEQVNQ